jgi:hypothetical protein
MTRRPIARRLFVWGLVLALLGFVSLNFFGLKLGEEVERPSVRELLTDDPRPEQPRPLVEGLVDSRTLEAPQPDGKAVVFEVNASSAVVALDVRDIHSDEEELCRLYPDFVSAARAAADVGESVLPSLNVLDAKAKQIDDGVMAALELHLVFGGGAGGDVVALLRGLRAAAGSDAAAWTTAALVLAGFEEATPEAQSLVDEFDADALRARPIGFHTWSPELERTYRTLRFVQEPLASDDPVRVALERALAADEALEALYGRVLEVQRLFTNHAGLPTLGSGAALAALLPPSAVREIELLRRLYPNGAPDGADTMADLVLAIRDGRLDLTPSTGGGWYEQRMHALEVFLLPERADEHEALMLSRRYKQRLVEAYQARVTNVLETHAGMVMLMASLPPRGMAPRLRVEPCATYARRIAASFTFVQRVLAEHAPAVLAAPGRSASGARLTTLADELAAAQRLFLGIHLVVCDDLGLAPRIAASELDPAEHASARAEAAAWLADWTSDPDLAVDTRIAFPSGPTRNGRVRTWCTTGVRAVRLSARYVHPPHVREAAASGATPQPWQPAEVWNTQSTEWIVLAEQFEELSFDEPPTRDEFRRFLESR